jgi:hypothetical protein
MLLDQFWVRKAFLCALINGKFECIFCLNPLLGLFIKNSLFLFLSTILFSYAGLSFFEVWLDKLNIFLLFDAAIQFV